MVPQYTPPNSQTQAMQTHLSVPNSQSSSSWTNYPLNNQSDNPRPVRTTRPPVEPIPVSYIELLPKLIQSQLLAHVPLTPMEPPYPRWYDANTSCDYHYGIKGYSTKNCLALKNNVQALKNAGYVSFGYGKAGGPMSLAILCQITLGLGLMLFWRTLWEEDKPALGML